MKYFDVTCTCIYNGIVTVCAKDENDAIRQARENFLKGDAPAQFSTGDVFFQLGEMTADYADVVE